MDNVAVGIIYGSFQLEIMTVLTDAGCYMGPTLLVTACTAVARSARHAVLARTLSCHLIAGLTGRSYRMAITRCNKNKTFTTEIWMDIREPIIEGISCRQFTNKLIQNNKTNYFIQILAHETRILAIDCTLERGEF